MSPARLPAALLWDCDGTLVDSEEVWQAAETHLCREWGRPLEPGVRDHLTGMNMAASAAWFAEWVGNAEITPAVVNARMIAEVVRRLRAEPVEALPGVTTLLNHAHTAGIAQAVVSNSPRVVVEAALGALPDHVFATHVCGDEVARGKPDPEPYLTACRLLGVDPADTWAFEDSDAGCRAASAAGCRVIAIENHMSLAASPHDVRRQTLAGASLAELGPRA